MSVNRTVRPATVSLGVSLFVHPLVSYVKLLRLHYKVGYKPGLSKYRLGLLIYASVTDYVQITKAIAFQNLHVFKLFLCKWQLLSLKQQKAAK